MVDLGVHLVDLALWTMGFPEVSAVDARLTSGGRPLEPGAVEDYATAQFKAGSAQVRLACSWRLNAGRDAVIEAAFYGTKGGAALRNVEGSFYDFTADRFDGTSATRLSDPPDEWGARSAAVWAKQLARSPVLTKRPCISSAAQRFWTASTADRLCRNCAFPNPGSRRRGRSHQVRVLSKLKEETGWGGRRRSRGASKVLIALETLDFSGWSAHKAGPQTWPTGYNFHGDVTAARA
ncbi:hypothetical protein ACFSHP_08020 [Novosphingobium panipatense]